MTLCPTCSEPVPENTRECPNCGGVLPPVSAEQSGPKREVLAKKVRHALHTRNKRSEHVAAEKAFDRYLKTAARLLATDDFANVSKVYESMRLPAAKLKHARLFTNLIDLLVQSAGILIHQKKVLAVPRSQSDSKRSSSPSLVGRLAWIPVFILAGLGLVSLLGSGIGIKTSPTQTLFLPSNVPSLAPTVTAGPTALPDPLPLSNTNIDQIKDLFHWSAGQAIESLSFSPDGKSIASGDGEGKIVIWRLWTNESVFEFRGTYAVFSPDGRWIGAAGSGGLELYSTDGQLARSLDKDHVYHSVLFSPDSQLIVGGTDFGKFFIWSVNNGAQQASIGGFDSPIHSLSFSQDGVLLGVVSNDNAFIWNLQEQKTERSVDFRKQKALYSSAAMDMDGQWFAFGQDDGQIYIWRISNGERMAAVGDGNPFVQGLEFFQGTNSPEVLVSGNVVNLSFWVMDRYDIRLRRSIYSSTPILSLAIAPENKLIATGGKDGVIHLWGILP